MTGPFNRAAVIEALRSVADPHIGKDIVSLGFVKEADVREGGVRAVVVFATPAFPSRERLREECAERLRALGAKRVELEFRTEIRGIRSSDRRDLLKDVRNVVAVASGKGGVGKSTVATNLAIALAKTGSSVGLLDADVYGPSTNLMLGVQGRPEVTQGNTMRPLDAHGLRVMSIAFLTTKDTPVIWRGPMVHGLVYQFLTQVEWGALDYLVIDLPPGTGDAQLTLTQTAPLAGAVIVTTPQDVSLVDARRGLKMFEQVHVPVLGIVENMSLFICPHCGKRTDIFGHGGGQKTSRDLGVPFLGEVPLDPEVVVGGDTGSPIVVRNPDSPATRAYVDLAERVAGALGRLAIQGEGKSASPSIRWE
jgi:ATP-binding protein involved in chromosome partitioning